MNIQEFRNYMENYEQAIEVHEDVFMVLCNYVEINNMVTFYLINCIKLVGETLWIGRNYIELEDVTNIYIGKVRSYIEEE